MMVERSGFFNPEDQFQNDQIGILRVEINRSIDGTYLQYPNLEKEGCYEIDFPREYRIPTLTEAIIGFPGIVAVTLLTDDYDDDSRDELAMILFDDQGEECVCISYCRRSGESSVVIEEEEEITSTFDEDELLRLKVVRDVVELIRMFRFEAQLLDNAYAEEVEGEE